MGWWADSTGAMLTDDQSQFVMDLYNAGQNSFAIYDFPPYAIVACGCVESGFGTSKIYQMTNCPFNLQKPQSWNYPQCGTKWIPTFKDLARTEKVWAPFCLATDLSDSVRLFCEWVTYYPNQRQRERVLATNGDAKSFARSLPLVGFGPAGKNSHGDTYANCVDLVSPILDALDTLP